MLAFADVNYACSATVAGQSWPDPSIQYQFYFSNPSENGEEVSLIQKEKSDKNLTAVLDHVTIIYGYLGNPLESPGPHSYKEFAGMDFSNLQFAELDSGTWPVPYYGAEPSYET